jgi:hypothetical protein
MSNKKTTPERLAAFSDGVFSVIITIMVLDLKPPAEATPKALLPLWPAALSYAVSYLFVAIIWVNHHRLASDSGVEIARVGQYRSPCVDGRRRQGTRRPTLYSATILERSVAYVNRS